MSYGGGNYNNNAYGSPPYNGGAPNAGGYNPGYGHNAGPQYAGGGQQPFGTYGQQQQQHGYGAPAGFGGGGRKIWNRHTGPPPNADMNYWSE